MNQSHTVIFTKLGRASVIRVHGTADGKEALDAAADFLGDPKYRHVTTITGVADTHSPKLDRFEEIIIESKPTAVIPRLNKYNVPRGDLITNGFTLGQTYRIKGWEGISAIVINDNGDDRVVALDEGQSAHIKIRKNADDRCGLYTIDEVAGYFEVVR